MTVSPIDPSALVPIQQYRLAPDTLKAQAEEVRALQASVLTEDVDFGRIPGAKKPMLFKSGAEWLLKWARLGHRMTEVRVREKDGDWYGVTYNAAVYLLDDPTVIVADADGYCGYDEPGREAHKSAYGKDVEKSPWNTIIQMSQKRALVAATLKATATSGLFAQEYDPEAPGKPVVETATPEDRATIQAAIAALDDAGKTRVRDAWWFAKVPGLNTPELSAAHIRQLRALLERVGGPEKAEAPAPGCDHKDADGLALAFTEDGEPACRLCGEKLDPALVPDEEPVDAEVVPEGEGPF